MPKEAEPADLFAVETPLGFTVRVSPGYWVVEKHPDLANRLGDVVRLASAGGGAAEPSRPSGALVLPFRCPTRAVGRGGDEA
jgi:hypothetical protein